MLKQTSTYFIVGILLFHIVVSVYATYSLFSDFQSWTMYHFYPIMLWIFTSFWAGITMGKRWCAFAYFMLVFFELANKLFFGQFTQYGGVLGSILFPLDLVFAFVILALYRQHFGDREAKK